MVYFFYKLLTANNVDLYIYIYYVIRNPKYRK